MNELKPQAFITEWYFTSEPKQKEAGTALWFPCCSGVKSSSRMNSIHYGLWRARNFGCPCLPVSQRNYAQGSSTGLWLYVTEAMSGLQTGSDELEAVSIWPCEELFHAAALHHFSLHWETQLQEERKPLKAVEAPKQSGHYQPVFFLLNLSHYGRQSAYTQSCVRKPLLQSRVLSQAARQRCWVLSVRVCVWCVKFHNLSQFSVEGNRRSKGYFCPILIKPHSIFSLIHHC